MAEASRRIAADTQACASWLQTKMCPEEFSAFFRGVPKVGPRSLLPLAVYKGELVILHDRVWRKQEKRHHRIPLTHINYVPVDAYYLLPKILTVTPEKSDERLVFTKSLGDKKYRAVLQRLKPEIVEESGYDGYALLTLHIRYND